MRRVRCTLWLTGHELLADDIPGFHPGGVGNLFHAVLFSPTRIGGMGANPSSSMDELSASFMSYAQLFA